MQLKFTKMHGLGNDFVLIDSITSSINLTIEQIKYIANRKYGVGCDQVLLIEKPIDLNADFHYRIFNVDGHEAEHCGNGARCVITYLYQNNYTTKDRISLQIKNRIISGYKNNDKISIDMGIPDFTPEALPFLAKYNRDNSYNINIQNNEITFGIASVGNPHAIIQLNSLISVENLDCLKETAIGLQNSPMFPNQVNVNFFAIENKSTISLLTYERGAGFTQACGTGSTATVCYGILKGVLANTVTVKNNGGELLITWDGKNKAILTGDTTFVFEGTIWI
jgi:diaminopimelate epimerase